MTFCSKFFTSDLHFGHHSILQSCSATRPFDTVEEMDAAIIERINDRVEKTDLLYILGDFTLSRDAEYVRHCFHSINGRKVLILGNHDMDNKGRVNKVIRDLPWDMPPQAGIETTDGGHRVYLHHYACRVWPASHHGSYHFYGHSHGRLPSMGLSRDVGIDCPDLALRPAMFSELKETLS